MREGGKGEGRRERREGERGRKGEVKGRRER